MKDEKTKDMRYVGFNQHDCEAIYKCPVCGKIYYGWGLWQTKENKGILECKCHTLLNIPK